MSLLGCSDEGTQTLFFDVISGLHDLGLLKDLNVLNLINSAELSKICNFFSLWINHVLFFAKSTQTRLTSVHLPKWPSLILFGIIISIGLFWIDQLTAGKFQDKSRADATLDMLDLRRDIEGVLMKQSLVLNQMATLIGANPNISQSEFSSWIRQIPNRNVSAVTIIAARDAVISMVHPTQGNEDLIGFNYQDDIKFRSGGLNTLGFGKDLMVGPVEMAVGGLGIVFRSEVYIPGSFTRVNSSWGIVSVVFDYQSFIDKVGLTEAAGSYDLLIDFSIPSSEYQGPLFGDKDIVERKPISLDFNFPYGALRLHATPKGGWPTSSPMRMYELTVMVLVAAGLLWLLGYVLWLAEKRRCAEIQLKNGIEALNDGFVMFDADDNLVLSNSRYQEIHGFPNDVMQPGTP